MCGITFVHKKDKTRANKAILKRYMRQKERGSDGFGYIAIGNNKLKSYKRAKLESDIRTQIEKEESSTILFHHRFPTSTPNLKESAHPIKVSSIDLKYDYYLVHNGIIDNADDLKEKHEKLGFIYNTEITKKFITSGATYKESMFNDSEALAIEIALAIDGGVDAIEAKGSIAFVVAQVHKSTNAIKAIHYGRNYGNPLQLDTTKELISIGSQTGGQPVDAYKLFTLDLRTNKITSKPFDIPNYSHYTGYNTGYMGFRHTPSIGFNPAETIFGNEEEDDWGFKERNKQLVFDENKSLTPKLLALQEKYQEIEFQIMDTEKAMKLLEDNDDGSIESENSLVEAEAVLDSLYIELEKIDDEMMAEANK